MTKYKLFYIIIISIILLVIFPVSLNFVTLPLGIFYIINYLIFIIFWIIPVVNLYKNNSKIKKYIYLLISYIFIALLIGFIGNSYGEYNNKIKMNQVRDTTRLTDYKKVESIILGNKNLVFDSLSDIENKSDNKYNISDPTTCYYYNYDGNDYVFALKFQSEKYISKFGEIFIFKSNKEKNISKEIYSEINIIVNNKCN